MADIKTSFFIDERLYKKLKKRCIDNGQSIKNAIHEAIDEWLAKRGIK